jgi:hypothetical protein
MDTAKHTLHGHNNLLGDVFAVERELHQIFMWQLCFMNQGTTLLGNAINRLNAKNRNIRGCSFTPNHKVYFSMSVAHTTGSQSDGAIF